MSATDTTRTDIHGWRLLVSEDSHGQHKWVYLPADDPRRASWPQSTVAKYWLGLETGAKELAHAKDPEEAARNGFEFYKQIQSPDGHWSGAYGGPLFLIPGLVIGLYVANTSLRPEQKTEIVRYLLNKRRPEGGWGLHTAAPPTTFGTVMNYVSLRLLGVGPDVPVMQEIRTWIHDHGGAVCVPSWAKAWLSILGAYEWEGVSPIPPELWLLPEWVPFHPWRWWIQTRNVYIPLGYLYGTKFRGPLTPLVEAIRREIYIEPYGVIDFSSHRNNIHPIDVYSPHHPILDGLNTLLAGYEHCPFPPLRRRGIDAAYKLVCYEDENTGYQTIGPVSKMLNLVCRYAAEGASSQAFTRHLARIDDFLWMSEEGMMMTGTNGSQLWDIAFIAQAAVETGLAADEQRNGSVCVRALEWLDKAQMREDPVWYKEAYRHRTKGAWPFSTPEQGYTVSDCAGEGLKAVLALQSLDYMPKLVDEQRLRDCVDLLLTMQNPDGGFASYELVRGNKRLEWLNTAEVFGDIMIEYTYPECTTSAISALLQYSSHSPDYRRTDIDRTVQAAVQYVHDKQKPDGSWHGSWGICFTYAAMFALESLSLAGETYGNSASVRKACKFLVNHQMEDGGWGETYMSCVTNVYSQHTKSQVVQTSWALLGLMYARYPDKQVIRRGCDLIMSRQQANGSWLQEDVEGIFNKNCGIDYPNFKFSFTIWALGKAAHYLRGVDSD
ncbi:hypothetical protein NliqN6_6830 [Naganishia liquefaciens]|uniref:Terpene cyclase/mutase family member n=1 Tax=Naganishia liquefaciens TaxID=104408 RepID=A0A8H3YII2_9TREE|nr:hypothetical protein NliqN6_6830 [Naganishia liquefaciens]